jgi:hypothetical protein
MSRWIPFVLTLTILPAAAHAGEPAVCDTSLIKIMSGGYVPYAAPAVDLQQDGGESSYDTGTGTVFTKTCWPGMYSTIVDMRESYQLVGPASVDALPITASLHITGSSVGQCSPHSTCEPGYGSMGLSAGGAFLGGTNVVHGWQVGQIIDQTASFQVNVVPGTWLDLRIYLQTGVMGPPGSSTITNAQANFVLPDGYVLQSCHGATFTPPPPGTVDVPASRVATLAFRALGAQPATGTPAFECVLPTDGEARIALIDLRGRIVLRQDLGHLPAGSHRVDLDGAAQLPAGVYWARLAFGNERAQQRLVLLNR